MGLLDKAGKRLASKISEEMSLETYLERAKTDKMMYATAAERLLKAIGEPTKIDTRADERLGRIFSNKTISVYQTFHDIYGLENPLKEIVSYIQHSAQGLEERKQILYFLGPVGSSKSSIAKILKQLFETVPFYAIKGSPVRDNPLSLFSAADSQELGIPERYLNVIPSPWLTKRVTELNGDISQLKVLKLYPSEIHQCAISHIEAGDENNQDISTLVGKLNIRETLEKNADDPDAYSFSGGLCLGNRGIVEFSEMFKAPIKSLNPLLEATQSGFYKGTEAIAAIPFDGIIIAHSNESEWQQFRGNKTNEALIDRVYLVRIPYCLRYSEERKIYEKMLKESALSESPCAPRTLDTLAKFCVLSRLVASDLTSKIDVKMEVYNGESLKSKNITAKSVHEYVTEAHEKGMEEGFNGISTRTAFKALAATFNYDTEEIAANPFHLILTLKNRVRAEHFPKEEEDRLIAITEYLLSDYLKSFDADVKKAYIENANSMGQAILDKYVMLVDFVLREEDYRSADTGLLETPKEMEKYLDEIEEAAHISNKKDFRQEVLNFCLRHASKHDGKNPAWTSYNKIKEVIEAKMFSNLDDMLPIISTTAQGTKEEQKNHQEFVTRMAKNGYTPRQTKILIDWYVKANKQ